MNAPPYNPFLEKPLVALYLRTALPIIMLLAVQGSIAVADAWFLGRFVGAEALAAVTLIFPFYMAVVGLSSLVSAGASSLMARHLGAGRWDRAREVFVGAHGLSLALCLGLLVLFSLFGNAAVRLAAERDVSLAELAMPYLQITVLSAPLTFLLALNSRALQNQGRIRFMTGMSLLVSAANIGFNHAFIVGMELGVAGSALGTAAAQAAGLGIIYARGFYRGRTLSPSDVFTGRPFAAWRSILALGASHGLGLLSVSVASFSIIKVLQGLTVDAFADTVSAYGIVTRVQTFAFLPLMGLRQAMQSITGNNHGAALAPRVNASLRIAFIAALAYGAAIQLGLLLFAKRLGFLFIADPSVVAALTGILPLVFLTFVLSGPLMIVSAHFQAIGKARMSILLGLSKPYLFVIPMIYLLPSALGEMGLWLAWAVGDALLLVLTGIVLLRHARETTVRANHATVGVGDVS